MRVLQEMTKKQAFVLTGPVQLRDGADSMTSFLHEEHSRTFPERESKPHKSCQGRIQEQRTQPWF